MLHINRATLLGRAGRDPDVRTLNNGGKAATFPVATTEKWTDRDGRPAEATEWHRIVVYGPAAAAVETMLRKGDPVVVEGRVAMRTFRDNEGTNRTITEIVVAGAQGTVSILPGRRAGPDRGEPAPDTDPGDQAESDADGTADAGSGDWPYLWLDATYLKVRQAGRIVSVAVTVAVAVNDRGRREVLGMAIGASEAETFWTGFLRSLTRRGLRGVKLVIADDHKGLKAAATRILGATAQRCRVHFMRNLLAHAGKQGRRVVSAFVATAFAQDDADSAAAQWRLVADQLKPKAPKLAALMDEAQHDVLAYMSFPREHRQKLHSTNPLERLNGEIKRRTNVVGIFPNEDAITRLVGAILLEQNDEWAVSRRYMTLESIAQTSDNLTLKLPTVAV